METFAYIMNIVNIVILVLFVLCYSYQIFYTVYVFFHKKKEIPIGVPHRLAILVCARNEQEVISALLESLAGQDYDTSLYSVFVLADNCTDETARVARESGATRVYVREDSEHIGKGYAMEYLLSCIDEEYGKGAFDAFVVFDADNLVCPNYLTEINRVFSSGYEIVASYRNSKNYGDSWVSAGSGLWFIRDAKFLNSARVALGASAWLAGTGFLFSNKIKELHGGWPFHTLTEDIEFMVDSALKGYRVGYAEDAEFFDEQPVSLSSSFWQRLRWARGGLQVFCKYYRELIKEIFRGNLVALDYTMSILPAYVLTVLALLFNVVGIVLTLASGTFHIVLPVLLWMAAGLGVFVVMFGVITTLSEWKRIRAGAARKIWSMFTFLPFMVSYVPIAAIAMFVSVRWKQTRHSSKKRIEELMKQTSK